MSSHKISVKFIAGIITIMSSETNILTAVRCLKKSRKVCK